MTTKLPPTVRVKRENPFFTFYFSLFTFYATCNGNKIFSYSISICIISLMQPGDYFCIDLLWSIDSHPMRDHCIPCTCCFEAVRRFCSLELDAKVKMVCCYM